MDTKNIVYFIIFSICIYFLANKKFTTFDILIVTIGIYCINFSIEKFSNKEGFTGNDKYMTGLSEIGNTEKTMTNLAEVINNNQKVLDDNYDETNMKILNDQYIFKDDDKLLNLDALSENIKPVPGELESDINKITFFSKSGYYNNHEIDLNGNIKDKFGNIVAQSDSLKKFKDLKIDNYGNIINDNGEMVDEVGNEDNIKIYLNQMAKEGKLENYRINGNGGIVDQNDNVLYTLEYLKIFPEGSIINKLGFIVMNNTILGHLGGDNEGLDAIIQYSIKGNLDNHMISNGGTISIEDINIAKLDMLSRFDGNKIDNRGYIVTNTNQIIGFIGGDEKAKDILILAALNGEFDGFKIDVNGSIIDKESKLVGQLEYLRRFPNAKFNDKGFILDFDGNVIGHIGGPTESLKIILKMAKDGMLNGFNVDTNGNIINKKSKIVASFDNLRGYPTLNIIDKYGNILNDTNQYIGYIGGEEEARKLLISLAESGITNNYSIRKDGIIFDMNDNLVTKIDGLKTLFGSFIDSYGNILNKTGDIISHVDPVNGIYNILIKQLDNGFLNGFSINNVGEIIDKENKIITKYDFLSNLFARLIHEDSINIKAVTIDNNGNIVIGSNKIGDLKTLMILNKILEDSKNLKGKIYKINDTSLIDMENNIILNFDLLNKYPTNTIINETGNIISQQTNNILGNISEFFESIMDSYQEKIKSVSVQLEFSVSSLKDNSQKEINLKNINKFKYGYSFLHPDYWGWPNPRKPICENTQPCRVCPKQTLGYQRNLMKFD